MSEEGDVDRWRPVSGPSGVDPDDPTGPIPAVTGEGPPGFPPVADEPAPGDSTADFSVRAPFEPADHPPLPESFGELRRSLAERMALPAEPEGGPPDLPPADSTPPFGVHAQPPFSAEEESFGEHPPMWDTVVAPTGPPPQPGMPSSANTPMPDWMNDGRPAPPAGEEPRHSRLPLFAGIGVLLLGLIAAGGVVALKDRGDASEPADRALSPTAPVTSPRAHASREKRLARFPGRHTKPAGRITDHRAGLTYPRLRAPWSVAPKKSPTSEIGFSASQVAVTERSGGRSTGRPKRWARLMSAELAGAARTAYHGPGTERAAAMRAAELYEARLYAFRHRRRLLATQPLNVGGHRGWLVGYYLKYHRPRVRATAEVFTVAVVDTGRAEPGVLLMTVPNTSRKLWPDINYVLHAVTAP